MSNRRPENDPTVPLDAFIRRSANRVDRALRGFLPSASTYPRTLHEAMRYSVFAGGKRLRPALCLAAAEVFSPDPDVAVPAACAVECIHTYSLIHDDLPCMDDDDLRRGMPTSHKKFGEGVAVLAGDALLTIAFEILSSTPSRSRMPAAGMVRELAVAAGSRHLIAGQVADIEAEGQRVSPAALRKIHRGKTAAMISVSLRLGGMAAGAGQPALILLGAFGQNLGLAFQIIDDLLDVTQSSDQLGKSAGKDARDQKSTFPAIMGIEKSKKEAARLTAQALESLDSFGSKADRLRQLADYLLRREY